MLIRDRAEAQRKAAEGDGLDHILDEISRKIDALSQRMSDLGHEPRKQRSSKSFDFAESIVQEENGSSSSFGLTPSSSSISSTPIGSTSNDDGQTYHNKNEYEGESSLFAHAVFASRFLQNAINSTTNIEVAQEMESVLEALRTAVHSGKQQSDALNKVYPHAKAIPYGSTTRQLPLPPVDKVFTCLRMAREYPRVAALWFGEFMKPNQFSEYFIKIASSGPATEADLIIVHCGLYWLFSECARAVADHETKQDYDAQASLCTANLETVLANLRFHQVRNIDLASAMCMASLYCLRQNKPSAAWSFINSASQMVLALGLHHNIPTRTHDSEEKARQKELFWTIYRTEKMLSLRLGRSSSFRDQDITLARPIRGRPGLNFLGELNPGWTSMASIQGRIYDDIYSPGALMQPPLVRTSRARALAVELKTVMQHAQDVHDRYEAQKGHVLGLDYHEIAKRSDRVIGLCMLTLIYRSIAPEKPSTSAFCPECINAARDTLQEHEQCVAVITRTMGKTVFLETYINWLVTHGSSISSSTGSYSDYRTITQSPFIPFIIIFCHIIESSDGSDLKHIRNLVETFESTSHFQVHSACEKQHRLFKALYDVAEKYIEVKSRPDSDGQGAMSWQMAQQQYANAFANTPSQGTGIGTTIHGGIVGGPRTKVAANTAFVHTPSHVDSNGVSTGFVDGLVGTAALQNTAFGDVNMEMDLSGAQLWDWFNKHQSIMSMLEDT
ncbi:hypothetical protein S40288_10163 [Stachybotrys chartarum IBT 40288]|nr:hypothetical protein S40288_10163 [Stachybotrys chartarum IBT 40288]